MTGADLRDLRHRLGWTQAEVAELIGAAANTVARWERGELRIVRSELIRVALETAIAQQERRTSDHHVKR